VAIISSTVGSGTDVVVVIAVLEEPVVVDGTVVDSTSVVVGTAEVVGSPEVVVLDVVVEVDVGIEEVVVLVESGRADEEVVVGSTGSVPACAGSTGDRPIRPASSMASVSRPDRRAASMGARIYYGVTVITLTRLLVERADGYLVKTRIPGP
jgi:hypothetical protein